MGCFSCFKSWEGSKKSWKCWKGRSSTEDRTAGKRKGQKKCCLCGGKPSKDDISSNKKRNIYCFVCKKSCKDDLSKDEEQSRKTRKCGLMGCFHCNKSAKAEESTRKRGKCGTSCFFCNKSLEEEEQAEKRRKCGMSCFDCNKSSKDEEASAEKGKRGMGCFDCNKSSKDEGSSKNKGKCGMDCFNCNKSPEDEGQSKEKAKCGMCCFSCNKSSKDEGPSKKKEKSSKDEESSNDEGPSKKKGKCGMCCFVCDKSSKDEEQTEKKGKCGIGCFCCNKSSKDEGPSKEKGKCGVDCFNCNKSPEDEGQSKEKAKCWMCCFSCNKSSKDEGPSKKKEKSSKDEESSNDEGPSKKKGKCGMCCFVCDKSSKDEEPTEKKGKCGMGCFCCNKSTSKDEGPPKKKGKCGMGCFVCDKSSKDEESSQKKGKCGVGCFVCDKSSKDEESSQKKGKCGRGCFCCNGSSNEEDLSKNEVKSGLCCFNHNKGPSEDSSKTKGEGRMRCFNCCKPSKKEEVTTTVNEKETKCCMCAKLSKRKASCFSCFRSSKKKNDARKREDDLYKRKREDGTMDKPQDEETLKEKRKRGRCSLSGCSCCSAKKTNDCGGKKMFCWKKKETDHLKSLVKTISFKSDSGKHRSAAEEILRIGNGNITARVFSYRELVEATKSFSPERLLGKGGFGKVYKGQLKDTNQIVAVKKLDRNGHQGNKEFIIEVLMLSLLSHPNLVNLIGYCADGDERILVYEYMALGSLQEHLLDLSPNSKPLDWNTRMKIAAGAARGLEHLHDSASPPVIYRDLKASNILLDEDFNPKLADFGLAKIGPVGDKHHVSTRVMGTYGYCAPEYALTGKLTTMSDIYSFGVVLLELITGRKAMDTTRPRHEQKLLDWAAPHFKNKKNFAILADPLLEGNFPVKAMYQALAVAAMCLQEEETTRPLIKDVVFALQFLAMPEKSISENPTPRESQTEISASSFRDTDSLHDWQSCSDDEEEIKQETEIE